VLNRLMEQNVFLRSRFSWHSYGREVHPDGGEQQDSSGWIIYRRADVVVPLRHWIVNVRASYFDETREQIDGMWGTLGYKKIGVIYPEDAFWRSGARRCKDRSKTHGAEPIAVASYQRQTAQVGGAIDTVRAAKPDAVVLVGPANTVAPILKQAHAKGGSRSSSRPRLSARTT